jgi:IS4 transposase
VTQVPAFVHITCATVNDMNAMDVIPYEIGAYYIFDRGYIDYTRLYKISSLLAYFEVRAKSNLKFQRMYSNKIDETTGVLSDQIGKLTGFYASKQYTEKIRRLKYFDEEAQRTFVYLTNNMELSAVEIALLYKNRWQVELFFYGKHILMQS